MENKFYAFLFLTISSLAVRAQDSSHCNAAFIAAGGGSQIYFLAGDSATGVTHFWNFGDTTTLGFGNFSAVVHTYSRPGMYTVIHLVRDSAHNCRDSASQLVYIAAPPSCAITFYYSHDSIHGGPYAFYANANLQGVSADTVTWTIGGAMAGRGDTLIRTLQPGAYTVCATLSTNLGCRTQYCQNIIAGDSLPGIVIPPDTTKPPVTVPPSDSTTPPVIVPPSDSTTPPIIVPPSDSTSSRDSATLKADSLSPGSSYILSWPNPGSSQVNMDVTLDRSGMIGIRVYNNMGIPVLAKTVAGHPGTNRLTLPIANLQNGIYFIQVQYGNETKRSRIQKM